LERWVEIDLGYNQYGSLDLGLRPDQCEVALGIPLHRLFDVLAVVLRTSGSLIALPPLQVLAFDLRGASDIFAGANAVRESGNLLHRFCLAASGPDHHERDKSNAARKI